MPERPSDNKPHWVEAGESNEKRIRVDPWPALIHPSWASGDPRQIEQGRGRNLMHTAG